MSDSGIQVTPEDRERLAKSKFGEWFDEFFDKKFEEAFEKKSQSQRRPGPAMAERQDGGQQHQNASPPPQRKRSLLEACLTDTFGF